ncbi:MAG: preprotein translocase subunit SecA [Planctomycetia bacterium]|nr:preprotein translocase subunit SecA [Planctomycetia bacterium]
MRRLLTAWRLATWRRKVVPAVHARGARLADLEAEALRKESRSVGYRLKCGEPIHKLVPDAFALVCEAARRTIGLTPYDVQLLGGMALLDRAVIEMQTGEGKTLTALLPAYVRSLAGKGMHVATANDYLAARDAETMLPVYQALGLTVGTVTADTPPPQRRAAYRCDITYGTAKEFGFDFLRDRLTSRTETEAGRRHNELSPGTDSPFLQRPAYCMLVDEADSILIDEASTPLVIGGPRSAGSARQEACYRWSASITAQLAEGTDFISEQRPRRIELTAVGRRHVRELPKPVAATEISLSMLYEFVERALRVERDYLRDRHYVVRENPKERRLEVVIIDEFTGRPGEGRRWQDGIHEAIEAKEKLEIQFNEGQAARVTVQDFFGRYPLLCGMSGTAAPSRGEFRGIYKADVVTIPTHRPSRRLLLPARVLGTTEAKWRAVVEEVRELHAVGRPVLIGTRSIDKSHQLSTLLTEGGIAHEVLNAYRLAEEARIIAQAGECGRVTVATNMAGRGTDIHLSAETVALGGLHVIGTELHEAQRIDRQLIGRCGRQGDPGSFRQFLALDDDILKSGFGEAKAERIKQVGASATGPLESWLPRFRTAQRTLETRQVTGRKMLLHQEQQRRKSFGEMGLDVYLDAPG